MPTSTSSSTSASTAGSTSGPILIERDFQNFTLVFRSAFEGYGAKRAALAREALLSINLAPRDLAKLVFGVLPALKALRPGIAAISETAATDLDDLEPLASGLLYAQTVYETTSAPPEELPKYIEEATRLREVLLADVQVLVKHDLINEKSIEELKGSVGYSNVAADLGNLVQVLRSNWETVGSKIPLPASELDKAEGLSEYLQRALAQRATKAERVAAAGEDRQRAVTLLLNAYDEVRRAVAYVRWHEEDVDTLAPSPWTNRGNARKAKNNDTDPATPVTPANPVQPQIGAPVHDAAIGTGLPNSNPYADS